MQLTLKRIYHTPNGKLRAQVKFNGTTRNLRIETVGKKGSRQVRVSFISNPAYLPSFSINAINHDTQEAKLEIIQPGQFKGEVVSFKVGETKEV